MRKLIPLIILCLPTLCWSGTSTERKEAIQFAQGIVADAYSTTPQQVTVQVGAASDINNNVPWISAKRRGAIWVSPTVLTWDSNAKPVWRMGIGSSYSLGEHSSVVGHLYKNYTGDKKTRPQIAWVFNF